MGFLACYKLVGADGGFIMYSNARDTNKPPIKGIWKPGIFELDTEDEIPDMFDAAEYGTQLEFTLKKSISIDDVRDWIKTHSEWASFPIIYEEYDEDNSLVESEEFGATELSSKHENQPFTTSIITSEYECICSPEQSSLTLLLNSPLNRNCNYDERTSDIINPKKFDIKLNNENGIVIKGPNKGLMPVSSAEYNDMDDERKENYIIESELNQPSHFDEVLDDNVDICLPKPTGTRDTLERDSFFWSYVHKKIQNKIERNTKQIMEKIEKPEDFIELPYDEKIYLIESHDNINISKSITSLKTDIKNKFNIELSTELERFYISLYEEVRYVKRNSSASEAMKKDTGANSIKEAGKIISESGKSGEVFMGVSLNQSKMNAAWEANENNIVIHVENADFYERYKNKYGWKKLQNVEEYIDIDNLNEELKNYFQSSKSRSSKRSVKGIPIDERELNIHSQEKRIDKIKVKNIYEKYLGESSKQLILFPSNCDKNLSDYRSVTSEHVHIANSLVKISEYLSELENINSIEEWSNKIYNMEIISSDGLISGEEIINEKENIVFHVIDESSIEHFQDKSILSNLQNILHETGFEDERLDIDILSKEPDEITYIPITEARLDYISSVYDTDSIMRNVCTINKYSNTIIGCDLSKYNLEKSELYWYVWAKDPSLRKTEFINSISVSDYKLSNEWVSIVDRIIENNSVTEVMKPDIKEKIYRTSEGKQSIYEIEQNYQLIIAHVLPKEISMLIKNDVDTLKGMKSYVYNNSYPTNYYGACDTVVQDRCDIEDSTYIPLTMNEINSLEKFVDDKSIIHTISQNKSRSKRTDSHIDSNTIAYASAKLSPLELKLIKPSNNEKKIKDLSKGGLELVESIREVSSL